MSTASRALCRFLWITTISKMANDADLLQTSSKMNEKVYSFKDRQAYSLLFLCVKAVVDNVAQKGYQLEYLPSSLKAKILHVMSKRHGMINSTTLPKLVTEYTRTLDFTSSSIPDLGLLTLPRLPYLYKIDLNDTRTGTRDNVTSESITHISHNCPNLRILYLRRCINICDKGVTSVAVNCRHLTELNVSGCVRITDRSVETLAQNSSSLTNLNMAYTSITDSSIFSLAHGVCADKLQEIHISYCKNITDEAVEALLHGALQITYLEIQGCPLLTDQTIMALNEPRSGCKMKQINYTIPL